MNMNYNNIPYEANYSDDMAGMHQMSMPAGSMPMTMPMGMPMNMPVAGMNQMQLPMGNMPPISMPMTTAGQMSYPMQRAMMQSQPMNMLQQAQANQLAMSMSQLPPGAVTPLNSVSVMPVMGGGGGIDGGGMNVVVPDLQPLSAMSQMNPNTQMPHMHQGRMTGGSSAGNTNWMQGGNATQMMPNNMWNYAQSYQNMQQQHQQAQQQQQQQQQQQLQQQQLQQQHQQHQQQQEQHQQHNHQQRMKSHYDYSNANNYRETRNGLNSPSMHDALRLRSSSGCISGKKVPQWR
ncbi:uncharacterized protein LOC135426688 [Drosophila montana]|uniref:uncharacterized protein LOC135426688 n=1 Tax=Drosophila montana TaxID=40370 RepID=UPI00313B5A17